MLMGMMIVVGFIVGFLVGCTGIGGIILIPALVYLSGLSSHVAMGTTLFTFIFTTSLCSWLYIRLGHVDWKATIPICIGGFLFTYVGADVKAFTAAPYRAKSSAANRWARSVPAPMKRKSAPVMSALSPGTTGCTVTAQPRASRYRRRVFQVKT